MRIRVWLAGLALLAAWAALGFAADPGPAAEPPPAEAPAEAPATEAVDSEIRNPQSEITSPALALVPNGAVAFVHLPRLDALEKDILRFTERTGWHIGHGDHPLLDGLARRTGIREGLDTQAPAAVAFLDPKRYRNRGTVYILPVADWQAVLSAGGGEEMGAGLYALTGAAGPRFVKRVGRYAVVTSSVRTMDDVAKGDFLLPNLLPETRARAEGPGPMLYVNVDRLKQIYEGEIASWFRAASGQMYYTPEAVAYADMMVTYMLGIADFIDQMLSFEVALRFGPEGVSADLSVRFADGRNVAQFLSRQTPGPARVPPWGDAPVASASTLRLAPAARTEFLLKATKFFLEKAPRPEPLPEPTQREVYEAMQTLLESLGDRITYFSAPAATGLGMVSQTAVYDLKDPDQFRRGVDLLTSAWERLASQLDLYLKIRTVPDSGEINGIPVTLYIPKFRFGIPARHAEFREWLKTLYGPEGLVYRVAVVKDKAVVGTGADLTLFRKIVERVQEGEPGQVAPAFARLEPHMPKTQNLLIATSLPAYLRESLLRGGTDPDRVGTVDVGSEMVGLGFAAVGNAVEVGSYWPHEQLRLARDLLQRVAPEVTEAPESLFEPSKEGPPEGEGGKAPGPNGAGAPGPEAAPPVPKEPAPEAAPPAPEEPAPEP